ncbi:acylphosphatase [Methanothrix sp.]|uniref:acylphosphatase n=1 Tax=Methanothrix sp. TaxID=90426 RepID=UPI0025F2FD08|nr:acylphosphatase [Methanothrix sp.]
MIENLKDGRVKIIAEGEDEKKLRWFEDAIDIKNALIYVSSIEKSYSPASGEFNSFGKLVAKRRPHKVGYSGRLPKRAYLCRQ